MKVSLITCKDRSRSYTSYQGIQIIPAYRFDARFNKPYQALSILFAMFRSHADVYIHSGGHLGSFFSRLLGRKSIFEILSDGLVVKDVTDANDRDFYRPKWSIANVLHRIDLLFADEIFVQTRSQESQLLRNYRRSSKVFPVAVSVSDYQKEETSPPFVLWVGSMAFVKGPHRFLELATALESVRFKMIGGSTWQNASLYREIERQSRSIPNLEFLGPLSFETVRSYHGKAAILVNTSIREGFPHAFLEAWASQTPVISLYADPDEIICRKRLGLHSRSMEQLVLDVSALIRDPERRREIGRRGREYVLEHHDAPNIVTMYSKSILEMTSQSRVQG
jgi:glycosyltransferase involved in cell wall biosynthesis